MARVSLKIFIYLFYSFFFFFGGGGGVKVREDWLV